MVFHKALSSSLPRAEKTDARPATKLSVAAGLITTAWSLAVAGYHMARNPLLSLLRDEDIFPQTREFRLEQ
jgi:hypothetical protein